MSATLTDIYDLPQEYKDFRATIRQIVDEKVRPRAAEIDATAEYPWDVRKLFAEQDILALPFDQRYGGTGTGTVMLQIAVEEIAKACASSALILMIQELGTLSIALFGSDELKERLLPKCATGEWSPAFALSEPEAGSDVASMRTTAVRDGDEWVINGAKNWITNTGVADFYVVFAMTDREARRVSAFVVEADREGFSVGKLEHKLGIKGSPTGSPVFEDVRVPAANLIAAEGKGMSVALGTLQRTRLGAAAQAVGIAQGATDFANDYAKERIAFGKPINELQAIQFKLADMETRTAAARELLYKACAMADRNEPGLGKHTSMAKLFASDTAMWVTIEAIQVLGGYGYVTEYPVERMMRDAKITQIYEGTNEIQRVVVARAMRG
ncbi:MAG TPA: acyl-CoA dehydrogenase family protein [Solirubrobacteraceae bacterium]|nr:acyl-CoA dehydrogenase family protein [Solirubrobacteraceae bacterium]